MEYFSGTWLQNRWNWLCRQFHNRPFRNGTRVVLYLDEKEKKRGCWEWMYPEPLTVVARYWIPPNYHCSGTIWNMGRLSSLTEGLLLFMRSGLGGVYD